MKTCSKCTLPKSVSEFSLHPKTKDGLQPWCRGCRAEYVRMRRRTSPSPSMVTDSPRLTSMKSLAREAKDVPCVDCGVRYPAYVMQFDHVDPSLKKHSIDALIKKLDEALLLEEIEKCEVVCANCHMERTHGPLQRNGRKEKVHLI